MNKTDHYQRERVLHKCQIGIFTTILLILVFASGLHAQYGLKIIPYINDTSKSKELISKIKSLPNDVFEPATFSGENGIQINYRLFRPVQHTDAKKKYPLVVIFHHSGQIGTDNVSQLGLLAKLFAGTDMQKKYPAYILAPQFDTRSSDYALDSSRNVLASSPRACLYATLDLIDSLSSNLSIESQKIYAVGYSMGGSTVINALSARPEMFAAGISIAGIPSFEKIATLNDTPIWLIHGMEDEENPIDSDEKFYQELNSSGKILFWKLEGRGHGEVFIPKIIGGALARWLFQRMK